MEIGNFFSSRTKRDRDMADRGKRLPGCLFSPVALASAVIYIHIYRYRHFGHFLTHFAALSVTDTKQMVTIWTSRFEDLSLNCDLR